MRGGTGISGTWSSMVLPTPNIHMPSPFQGIPKKLGRAQISENDRKHLGKTGLETGLD